MFRVLRAARDPLFFAPMVSQTTRRTALRSFEQYNAYGLNYSPIKWKHFRSCFYAFRSFIFSYLESFFVVFYLSFYFVLETAHSARDTASILKSRKEKQCLRL